MSCERANELIHWYLDGEVNVTETLEFEQHLRECEICDDTYREQTALRSSLRHGSLYYHVPANLTKRIQLSVRRQAETVVPQRTLGWRWVAVGASLAFMLLITAVAWRLVLRPIGPSHEELLTREVISDHIRSLQVPGHLTDVISSDQHTVKPWFDGKLDFALPVNDFAAQGFRLNGGRLEYLNNRAVATLVYQRGQHHINLYVLPAEQGGVSSEVMAQRQGYNLIHWTSAGMNYWAISDLNNAELHEFVRLVQQTQ